MISIILVNYNSTCNIINCLKSLQNQDYNDFEVIIIDNNSIQTDKENLKDFLNNNELNDWFLNRININYSQENLGYTGGNNLGIKISRGDLILLLNDDTLHEPSFLGNMVDFFKKHKAIHIAQPKICFFPNKNIIWGNGGKISKFSFNLFKHINFMERDSGVIKSPIKIDYAIGCALFVRREVLQAIGLLDNIYFMYCEESDLCYRATQQGYNIYCNLESKIYHITTKKFSQSFKNYYFRNRLIFCLKNLSIPITTWQFFMQFIQLLYFTIDLKKKLIDYKFLFKSIKGILNGLKIGIIIKIKKK